MAADWFHQLGYTLPYGINVSDFILDLASGSAAWLAKCDAFPLAIFVSYDLPHSLNQLDSVAGGQATS